MMKATVKVNFDCRFLTKYATKQLHGRVCATVNLTDYQGCMGDSSNGPPLGPEKGQGCYRGKQRGGIREVANIDDYAILAGSGAHTTESCDVCVSV